MKTTTANSSISLPNHRLAEAVAHTLRDWGLAAVVQPIYLKERPSWWQVLSSAHTDEMWIAVEDAKSALGLL